MATERRPTTPRTTESPRKQSATDAPSPVDGSRAEHGATGTGSAIRDIIRRYRETFERLAR